MMVTKLVGYLRVSTKQQGISGLGLEAQRAAVTAYAKANDGMIAAWYEEIESGKRSDRPQLLKALAHVRRLKAKLVVAKLDRLARNVAFLSKLMESKTPFVACDLRDANELTIHILAAVAQAEASMISQRTKAALTAYKARGGKLGSHLPQCRTLTSESRQRGVANAARARSVAADRYWQDYADIAAEMIQWRKAGDSLHLIAMKLNERGETTRRGKRWTAVQVSMIFTRFANHAA